MEKKTKDPKIKLEEPKHPLNAYLLFCADKREAILQSNPRITIGQLGKTLGAMWRKCNETEKEKYNQLAKKERERFEKEQKIYEQAKEIFRIESSSESSSEEDHRIQTRSQTREIRENEEKERIKRKIEKETKQTKKSPTGYLLFVQKVLPQIKKDYERLRVAEMGKIIGKMWRELPKEEKDVNFI
ncbi:high mobility group protein dsp1 [Anaeramoeba ignava]|uniref:High mobility group protein dsp1 n=1 Tax=Anaeramoeba ignava TaxID=1746090 RepID=A0A9Q0LGW5_ANAIG|nr:high mobility group protein dsp1 [Anaeramoeba ignava]